MREVVLRLTDRLQCRSLEMWFVYLWHCLKLGVAPSWRKNITILYTGINCTNVWFCIGRKTKTRINMRVLVSIGEQIVYEERYFYKIPLRMALATASETE